MKLLFSGALVASIGLGAAGCNENTLTPNPTTLGTPSGLMASSSSTTSVMLKWTAPNDTALTGYQVSWKGTDLGDSSSTTVGATTTATVTGLGAGEYTFYVRALRGTESSNPVSMKWAAATRYTNDVNASSVTLRMYEFQSTSGSGLIVDPARGGPANASVAASSGTNPGSVQLALLLKSGNTTDFAIGPAYAFTDFRNADKFDSTTYVSSTTFLATSLDDWFLDKSLDTYITPGGTNSGNVVAYTLPQNQSGSQGQGFVMRFGNGASRHYARVFIHNIGGKLIQGTAPDRYVVVSISYQAKPDLPYAKGVVRRQSPVGVRATTGH